jgi:hypothetical protein
MTQKEFMQKLRMIANKDPILKKADLTVIFAPKDQSDNIDIMTINPEGTIKQRTTEKNTNQNK